MPPKELISISLFLCLDGIFQNRAYGQTETTENYNRDIRRRKMTENPENIDDFISGLHHSLRATRRRYVVQFLHETSDHQLTVRELARRIAAREREVPLDHATGEPYRNAYNALSQTHLPTLADAGILIYDSERQTVSGGPNLTLATLLVAVGRPTVDILQKRDQDKDT